MSSGMKERLCRSLEKVLHAETRELPAVAGGILLFFLLFLAYSMLRPVRETMGIAGGVQNLQWLFTATFAASIGGQFLFGWVSSKVRRKAILPWTYGFFILNLAVFAALVLACPGNVWTARSFYVWLSVFNLLTVSVAWSVLSDVMKPGQMKRLFALVASGSSLGAMAGPAVTAALAGVAGLLWLFLAAAVFLALAMLASFINNQRLVRSVGDHLAVYHRLSGTPPTPKLQAQQRLRADSRLLDDWLRRGEPLRYRLGLYQGGRLIPFVEAAINDWAPPPPPRPVIKQVVQGPQTIRLDSMALFDTGKSALKPGSTKLLVNSLLGIKAKPGWLIVVAGHTDSIGNDRSNQQLSLKRAEAVRDWMRDTGDVPESCFAVQGYGASRPVASNETPEGRAQNRRVEISLVPQKDACLTPGTANTSGVETNGLKSETE